MAHHNVYGEESMNSISRSRGLSIFSKQLKNHCTHLRSDIILYILSTHLYKKIVFVK